MGGRLANLLLLATLALTVTTAGTAATTRARVPILGVVPHAGAPPRLGTATASSPTDLSLQESPCAPTSAPLPCWTMRTNTTYAIYWIPPGYSVDASYESLVNRYLADVAAASGSLTNVYSVATQYYDDTAAVHYQSTFGGAYVDTTPFPSPNNCHDGFDAVCVTDADVQAEIQHVLTLTGWHAGPNAMFFVLTPDGVGSCFDAAGTQCTTTVYCAYHSGFLDLNGDPVIYANEPYAASIPGCFDGTSPNAGDADATINTMSHEHSEAITDPWGDAWLNANGDEIGDICASEFGTPLGGTPGVDAYNQVINGHNYWLQEEYSNDGGSCRPQYAPTVAPTLVAPPVLSGGVGLGQLLSTSEGSWKHAPTGYAYQWQRCTATGTGCANIAGATAAAYRPAAADVGHELRAEVTAHNGAGASAAAASVPSTAVVTPPIETAPPVLSGVAAVHKRLSTTTGAWSTTVTVAYRWLRCTADGTTCTTIPGATAATRVATAADAGYRLEARVTATNAAGAGAGFLEAQRRRHPAAGAPAGAADLRAREDRATPGGEPRIVERAAQALSLPVAPLQPARRVVRPHPPRDGLEVPADEARCAAPAAHPRHGRQRGRTQGRDLARNRPRAGGSRELGACAFGHGVPRLDALSRKRVVTVGLLAAIVLGVTASSGGAASRTGIPQLGVVPHANVGHAAHALTPRSAGACGASSCAAYESSINRYFTDVAADSGTTSNVYAAATQYWDATGRIAYQSTFGGSYVDTNAFPASGCDDGVDAVCLTDQQIRDELQKVLTAKGWHGSTTTMFFMMTPSGVGSCFYSGSVSSSNPCTTNAYCAYHSGFVDSNAEPVIYGNEPFNATIPGCDPGSSPNNDAADATINTISHEQNEAITDPWGTAWWRTSDGSENGDLCAWDFGTPLGGTPGVDAYNQVINGDHFWLQQEWSNNDNACLQQYSGTTASPATGAALTLQTNPCTLANSCWVMRTNTIYAVYWIPAAPTSAAPPTLSGTAAVGKLLQSSTGSWTGTPTGYAYQWQRCAANGSGCAAIAGATGPTYQLSATDAGHTIRSTVSAHNTTGSSAYASSGQTAVVVPLPVATTPPGVSGVAAVGKRLAATTGTWNTTATFAYGWERCAAGGGGCSAIPGATAGSYRATAADAGHTLRVVVTATNAAGTGSASSATTGGVVATPKAESRPRISGKPQLGRRISARSGRWLWSPTSFEYQWLRCSQKGTRCHPIKRATHARYHLTRRDAGHRLRVRVIALNPAGSHKATSRATKRVPAVPHR